MKITMLARVFQVFLFYTCLFSIIVICTEDADDDDDPYTTTDPKKREPSPCEICKFFANEFTSRLDESSKSKEVIETGQSLDKRKRFKYITSELRLTEALHEPHICEKILEYNVHAERKGSLRYAKGMSETMQTLHGLVNKGVKVELGIPYELWDKPSAEVSKMHRACFTFAEEYEDAIETWYYKHQEEQDLLSYLCADRFLAGKDQKCLQEVLKPKGDSGREDDDKNEGSKESKTMKNKTKKVKQNTDSGDKGTNKFHLKGDVGDATEKEHFTTPTSQGVNPDIPKPDQIPPTTPLPKTSRSDGDL